MRRIVDTKHGPMIVNDKDIYLGRMLIEWGEFSKGEIDAFRQLVKPGMTVADIGANIGAHTVVLSRLVGPNGRVLAFEPQRLVYYMLCGNLALNQADNVYAYQCAIGAEDEELMVHSLNPDSEQSFGSAELRGIAGGNEKVSIRRLTEPCQFVKIDVEGMENEVLAGAESMIREHKPILFVENEKEDKSAELIERIYALGYTPHWYVTQFFDPDNPNGAKGNFFKTNLLSFNMVCVTADLRHLVDLPVADCSHVELMDRWRREREDRIREAA